jgi:ABC-type Fe3+ transport system permease subunit
VAVRSAGWCGSSAGRPTLRAGRAWGRWRAWADVRTGLLLSSAAEALAVGLAAALAALAWGWLGRTSRGWRWAGLALAVLWWALPAPVLGYGLKTAIAPVVATEERLLGPSGPLSEWLYFGPSPVPGMLARFGRAFPWAALVVFPAVAALPRVSLEAARVEGLSPQAAWRAWVGPALGGPLLVGACLAGLAAFGEVSASAVVAPAGSESYTAEVFRQMHYGTSAAVAAAALHPWLLLGLLGVSASAISRRAPR